MFPQVLYYNFSLRKLTLYLNNINVQSKTDFPDEDCVAESWPSCSHQNDGRHLVMTSAYQLTVHPHFMYISRKTRNRFERLRNI